MANLFAYLRKLYSYEKISIMQISYGWVINQFWSSYEQVQIESETTVTAHDRLAFLYPLSSYQSRLERMG